MNPADLYRRLMAAQRDGHDGHDRPVPPLTVRRADTGIADVYVVDGPLDVDAGTYARLLVAAGAVAESLRAAAGPGARVEPAPDGLVRVVVDRA
ncbi:hypothetical protein [Spirilliplanes yamanashiensis]|uniref:Uncharacterized protein n=1 Tax=Spirilliplanes yamanashiensis TaxID=42233 RepID=A0A8J4DH94_9ACTN|nr:hypothetical protein [Spirilliplanes yamanashiensis]MDP9819998.1 hypothetical protein [Spirilliplanes yamanashiensis]GIJ01183.1 hypothetical protein Sya03_05350 [Spirilliplanes yamanashiensis]